MKQKLRVFVLFLALSPATAFADTTMDPPRGEQDPRSTEVLSKELDSAPSEYSRFGFSLGMGTLSATGNRGLLWEASSPMYSLAGYYWLTPQLAINIEGSTANNSYESSDANGGHVDVTVRHAEFATRYYGDLHALLPRIVPGFVSPFATIGLGLYSMTKNSFAANTTTPADIELGMTLGAGLRFEVVPRTLSLELMGRWNSVRFNDTYEQVFQSSNGVPDLTGQLVSWNANVLVTF